MNRSKVSPGCVFGLKTLKLHQIVLGDYVAVCTWRSLQGWLTPLCVWARDIPGKDTQKKQLDTSRPSNACPRPTAAMQTKLVCKRGGW